MENLEENIEENFGGNILDYVDLSNARKYLTPKDNILCCALFTYNNSYNKVSVYVDGILEFINMKHNFKMLIFYDDSISEGIIESINISDKIIFCKYTSPNLGESSGLFGTIIRYIPLFVDDLPFNYAYVCDTDRHFVQWNRDFKIFNNFIKKKITTHGFMIPLAGQLLVRNVAAYDLYDLKGWHRIAAYPFIIKHGNIMPISLMNEFIFEMVNTPKYQAVVEYILEHEYEKASANQGKFVYGCDELFLLSVMKYIEDNKIPFTYTVSVYTHRSPFYHWLEVIKPTEEKQKEFLTLVGGNYKNVNEFLQRYPNNKRFELYRLIKQKVDPKFFDSDIIEECIKRFFVYLEYDDKALYLKKWE